MMRLNICLCIPQPRPSSRPRRFLVFCLTVMMWLHHQSGQTDRLIGLIHCPISVFCQQISVSVSLCTPPSSSKTLREKSYFSDFLSWQSSSLFLYRMMQNHPSDKIKFEIFSNFSLLSIFNFLSTQLLPTVPWIIRQNLTGRNIVIIFRRHHGSQLMRGGNDSELTGLAGWLDLSSLLSLLCLARSGPAASLFF